jgi:hypothetical protein
MTATDVVLVPEGSREITTEGCRHPGRTVPINETADEPNTNTV